MKKMAKSFDAVHQLCCSNCENEGFELSFAEIGDDTELLLICNECGATTQLLRQSGHDGDLEAPTLKEADDKTKVNIGSNSDENFETIGGKNIFTEFVSGILLLLLTPVMWIYTKWF